MATVTKKKEGITGLNTSHALYSKVTKFLNFDDTITCLKTGTTYTSSAAVVTDADLGKGREFKLNSDVMSGTVPVKFPSTVVLIYKPTGTNTGGTSSDTNMFRLSGGDSFIVASGSWSAYDYRISRRGNFGTSYNTDYKPYAGSVVLKNKVHAMAVDYASGASTLYQNGDSVSVYAGTTAPTFTPSVSTINCTVAQTVGTTGSFILAGIICFDSVLTDAEKAAITVDPWDLVQGTLPLNITFDKQFKPGELITATLTNYTVTPTTISITDSKGATLSLPLTEVTNRVTYTFTIPALPTSNSMVAYLYPGSVNVTIGAKSVPYTFDIPTSDSTWTYNVEKVTLVSPINMNLFDTWGPDKPAVGDVILSEGSFDAYGNFTTNAVGVYKNWIIRASDSRVAQFLVTASVGISAEWTIVRRNLSTSGKQPVFAAGFKPASGVSKARINVTTKTLTTNIGYKGTIGKRSYAMVPKSMTLSLGYKTAPIPAWHLNVVGKAMYAVSGSNLPMYATINKGSLITNIKPLRLDVGVNIPVVLTILKRRVNWYGKTPTLKTGKVLEILNNHITLKSKQVTFKGKNNYAMIMVSRMYSIK